MILVVVRDISPDAVGGAVLRNRALVAAVRAVTDDVVVLQTGTHNTTSSDAAVASRGNDADPFHCDYHPAVADRLADLARQPHLDAVIVSEARLHRYFRRAVECGVANVAMDLHDAESLLWEEAARDPRLPPALRERIRREHDVAALRAIEEYASTHAKLVVFCSQTDERRFRERYHPIAATAMVPNSVQVPEHPPARLIRPPGGPHLLFVGHLAYLPNVDAVHRLTESIFPAVRRAYPEATLTIAGRVPGRPPTRLGPAPGVTRLENPPEVAHLFDGRILVVPLAIGSGTRLKILEAFAAGVPVISTEKGVEGLDVVAGEHYLGAGLSPDSSVRQVEALLGDPRADIERRRAAYELTRERYSWTAIEAPVRAALEVLLR